jgi:hypothetical protein
MNFPDDMPLSEKALIQRVAQKVKSGMFCAVSDYCACPNPNLEQAEAAFVERAIKEANIAGAEVEDVDTGKLGQVLINFKVKGHRFHVEMNLRMST